MAAAARSSGRIARRVPLKAFPTAVRTELTITASRMACLPLHLLDATHWMPQGRKNQPQVDSRRATPQTSHRRSEAGDGGDDFGTGSDPPHFCVSVDSKGLQPKKSRKCAFHGTYRRIFRKCVFQRSYPPRRTFLVSLHFPKNLRGRAAEHRIADLRVLIVSAKLVEGPFGKLRTQDTRPSTTLGTRKTSFALYYTAGVNGKPQSWVGSSRPAEPGLLRSVPKTYLRPRL